MSTLCSRFSAGSPVIRADYPLTNDVLRSSVPSIFADTAHGSRSDRYAYIPTIPEKALPKLVRTTACLHSNESSLPTN
ncbi:MAG: hypothetical protein CVV06_01950 [Gammaproteobacteria bacterium HGW-Gammaproteobacteria-10]|nr:MAG: hypothetical protein CVV06_01950 [Gammaproteobacteria bacterium HGW-Gammaproteobacteria-10]